MTDLISRADAMAYPLSWEHYDKEHGCREFICGVESYREYIEYLPSAQPKRSTGRWERHYSRPNVYADLWWHCSVCGYKNDDQFAYRYHHYCPNCGAKMEVEHETD